MRLRPGGVEKASVGIQGYARPESIEVLLDLLRDEGPRARIVAGGTDAMIRVRAGAAVGTLVNISRIKEMQEMTLRDGHIEVGATVTMSALLRSEVVREHANLLWQAADRFASPLVRSRATVGGNVVNASPAADAALALLALEAEVVLATAGATRAMPLGHFLLGPGHTALAPGEALIRVRFAAREPGGFQRFLKSGTRPALEIAIASVALALGVCDGRAHGARIACGSVAPVVMRSGAAEAAVEGKALTPAVISEAARAAAAEVKPIDDVRATALYRRRLVAAFVRRGLEEAADGHRD